MQKVWSNDNIQYGREVKTNILLGEYMKHPYELCDEIEKLPASEQQTLISTMAYSVVKKLLAHEQELARAQVELELIKKRGTNGLKAETARWVIDLLLGKIKELESGDVVASGSVGEDRLLPCPFCGNRAEINEDGDFCSYYVKCCDDDCGAAIFLKNEPPTDKIVAMWNRRARPLSGAGAI